MIIDTYEKNAVNIYQPSAPIAHRDEEYESKQFDVLLKMQSEHFWYQGRHRLLSRAFYNAISKGLLETQNLKCVDLGGGCGGWLKYLNDHSNTSFGELALADSSCRALEIAERVVGEDVARYQIDLLDLQWTDRWDVAFLLDVLEHIPEDVAALKQISDALRPGGLLFITTPALNIFWSYNDDLAHHVRRYSRKDYQQLADQTGLTVRYSRYFMFFLSPLLLLSRLRPPCLQSMTKDEIRKHLEHTHRIPSAPINMLLRLLFSLETPLGLKAPFPWGTSVLAVLQKPK
jgi:SAM-dependent methyltransferase